MRSAGQAHLAKYERALHRYFQIPASSRKTKDREKILKVVGVDNTLEFLTMHIPLWEVKIDDPPPPPRPDIPPTTIPHSSVKGAGGATRLMPDGPRVKI